MTKYCVGGAEVGYLTSMKVILLVFEGVGGEEFRATEALDVSVFDGARVKFRELLFRSDGRCRVALTGCHDRRGVRKDDVGVGHDGRKG